MSVDVDTTKKELRAVRDLRRSGNSTVVSIPPEILRAASLQDGDAVDIVVSFDEQEINLRPSGSSREE